MQVSFNVRTDTHQEKALIAKVNSSNRDYAIYLLHCAPKPDLGYYNVNPKLQLLYYNQLRIVNDSMHMMNHVPLPENNKLDLDGHQKLSIAALPELMKGTEHRATDKNWELLMRPVLTSKQECLSCHKTSKQGDTLGVMVYAVRKTKCGTSMKVGMN